MTSITECRGQWCICRLEWLVNTHCGIFWLFDMLLKRNRMNRNFASWLIMGRSQNWPDLRSPIYKIRDSFWLTWDRSQKAYQSQMIFKDTKRKVFKVHRDFAIDYKKKQNKHPMPWGDHVLSPSWQAWAQAKHELCDNIGTNNVFTLKVGYIWTAWTCTINRGDCHFFNFEHLYLFEFLENWVRHNFQAYTYTSIYITMWCICF